MHFEVSRVQGTGTGPVNSQRQAKRLREAKTGKKKQIKTNLKQKQQAAASFRSSSFSSWL